jgi:hypothetical protein
MNIADTIIKMIGPKKLNNMLHQQVVPMVQNMLTQQVQKYPPQPGEWRVCATLFANDPNDPATDFLVCIHAVDSELNSVRKIEYFSLSERLAQIDITKLMAADGI